MRLPASIIRPLRSVATPISRSHRHQGREERLEWEAKEQLEAVRAANAVLRPCWTCRGLIGGKAGSLLELTVKARPDRLSARSASATGREELGPLVLPAPTR